MNDIQQYKLGRTLLVQFISSLWQFCMFFVWEGQRREEDEMLSFVSMLLSMIVDTKTLKDLNRIKIIEQFFNLFYEI